MKLSIIIPAFNSEDTITRTLDSIFTLSLPKDDFEVIVAYDISVDKTEDILITYQQDHSNLVLLKLNENHRQGGARNRGLVMAKGEYIIFVDADDILKAGILDALKLSIKINVDVLICHIEKLEGSTIEERSVDVDLSTTITGKEYAEQIYDWSLYGAPWGAIFRRKYLLKNNFLFAEDVSYEDYDWILTQLINATSIFSTRDIVYRYVIRDGSSSFQSSTNRLADRLSQQYRILKLGKDNQKTYPNFYKKTIEITRHTIDEELKRIWKVEKGGWLSMYNRLGTDKRLYILQNGQYSKISGFILRHKYITCFALYLFAKPLQKLRNIINRHHV